jgi:hypothetical protein
MPYERVAEQPWNPTEPWRVWNHVGLWILQVTAAAIFLMAGVSKLGGAPQMVETFELVGIGQWFRYFTGGLEVVGAVLLLIPALAGVGAMTMALVMVGAIFTHLFVVGGSPAAAVVLLLTTVVVALGRRKRTAALFRSGPGARGQSGL